MLKKSLLPMFAAVLLVFVPAARADSLYGARISGSLAGGGTCSESFDTGWGNSLKSIDQTLDCHAGGVVTVSGVAMPGELLGYASGYNAYNSGNGGSMLYLGAFDTITAFSTDPAASYVSLLFSMDLHAIAYDPQYPATDSCWTVNAVPTANLGGGYWETPTVNLCTPTFSSGQKLLQIPVGTPFTVREELDLSAGTSWNAPSYITYVDALSTSNMYIDPVGSGITITSASGHNYGTPSAIPEPTTCVLLGSGLLGLVARTRRRQRK